MLFVEVVRLFIVVLCTAAGFLIGRRMGGDTTQTLSGIGGILGCLIGYVGGGMLGRLLEHALDVVEDRVARMPAPKVLAGMVGGVACGVAGAVLAIPFIVWLPPEVGVPSFGLIVWISAVLGFRIALDRSEDFFHALGLSTRPLVRASAFNRSDGLLLDTSAVMDTRLEALVRAGLVADDLLVPRFVLDELQGMADARDEARGRRARRGLELLEALRREAVTRIFVLDDEVPELAEVDAKLIALAARLQVRILTSDANLARNAAVQDIPVSNLRKLFSDLAPPVGAGETVSVSLTRLGRESGQGVGYLDDETMVVVNGGAELVGGGSIDVEITSVVPTSVGRMLFGRVPTGVESADAGAPTR